MYSYDWEVLKKKKRGEMKLIKVKKKGLKAHIDR